MAISRLLRRALREERGFTLLELMIASALTIVVTGLFLGALSVVQRSVQVEDERSQTNDQARLGVEELDREILSSNILYDPALESPPKYSLRIYTQTNASSRNPGFQCVQWLIQGRQLLRRSWPPGRPEDAGGWRVVATDVVNRALSIPGFVLSSDPSKGGRTLDVAIAVNRNLARLPDQTVTLRTSITGRNTTYGYSSSICSPAPA